MNVRKVRKGAELRVLPSGEEVVLCPRCGTRWLTRVEGSADREHCPHLRFTWYAGIYGGRPEYTPGWSPLEFERQVRERYAKMTRAAVFPPDAVPAMHDPPILARILRRVSLADIDEVRYLSFWETGPGACGEAAIFWGYQREAAVDIGS